MNSVAPEAERRRRRLVKVANRHDVELEPDLEATVELVLAAATEAARRQRRRKPTRDDALRWLLGDEALDPSVRVWVDAARRVSRQRRRFAELQRAVRNGQPLDLDPIAWP